MLCQSCNANPATVHVTQMTKGKQKHEMHLCESCAKQQGVSLKPSMSFSELLSGFIEPQLPENAKTPTKPCPTCGISYSDFREVGRLGCPTDYDVFKQTLLSLMDRIHRGSQHVGKIPSRAGESVAKEARVKDLEEQLKAAVRGENYELAAQLRDQVRLEREQGGEQNDE